MRATWTLQLKGVKKGKEAEEERALGHEDAPHATRNDRLV